MKAYKFVCHVGMNDLRWSHGVSSHHTPEEQVLYRLWWNMLHQCYNTTFKKQNESYWTAALTVCDRWKTLSNFVADVADVPGYDEWLVSALDNFNGGRNNVSFAVSGNEYNPTTVKFVKRSTHKRSQD